VKTVLNFLVVTTLGLRYDGALNDVYYRIGFTLNGVPKVLEFLDQNSGVLVTPFDLLSVVGQLGKEVLMALAPLDLRIDLPTLTADPICTPPFPCLTDLEVYCPLDRRRNLRALEAVGGGAARNASLDAYESDRRHDSRSITVSYLDAYGQTATAPIEGGTAATTSSWQEEVPEAQSREQLETEEAVADEEEEDLGEALAKSLEAQLNAAVQSDLKAKGLTARGDAIKIVQMVGAPSRLVPYTPIKNGLVANASVTARASAPHLLDAMPPARVKLPPLTKEQEKRLRRRLSNCDVLQYRLRLTDTCGTQLCITPRMSVGGYVRLQITEQVAAIEGSMRLQITGPGMGLPSIDETIGGRVEIAYAEAKNVCDIVPGLNDFCLGRIGGGETTFSLDVLGVTLSLTLNFNVVDVCLVDLLPCNLIPL